MSWSLELRNGDLTVGGARLGQATGPQKLVQDLRCALLEHRGHDEFHPEYGSLIDGGVDEYGVEAPSIIGQDDWSRVTMRVEAEIRRICLSHQQTQVLRAKADRVIYGESTLTNDEVLLAVESVEMQQAEDKLMVRVTLNTGDEQPVIIDVPVAEAVA